VLMYVVSLKYTGQLALSSRPRLAWHTSWSIVRVPVSIHGGYHLAFTQAGINNILAWLLVCMYMLGVHLFLAQS
jgi:hypothetical protein